MTGVQKCALPIFMLNMTNCFIWIPHYLISEYLIWLTTLFNFLIFNWMHFHIWFPFVWFGWLLHLISLCFIWLTTLFDFLMLNLTDFPWFGRPWGLRDFPLVFILTIQTIYSILNIQLAKCENKFLVKCPFMGLLCDGDFNCLVTF